MNRVYRKSPFWSVCGPFLIFMGIEMAVQTIVEMIVMIPYMAQLLASSMKEGSQSIPTEDAAEVLNQVLTVMAEHQVEIAALCALCTLPMTIFLFRKDRKLEQTYQVPVNKKAGMSKYPQLLILGAAFSVGFTCLSAMAEIAFYSEQYQEAQTIAYAVGFPVQILCLGILAPLAEEMMFSGVLSKRYRENNSFSRAAIYSALLFALIHNNTIQMIYGFVTGMFLAYVCEKYGSILAPVFLHIIMNTVSLIFTEAGVFNWLAAEPFRMACAVILSAFFASVVYVLIQKIEGKPEPKEPPTENKITPDMFR